MDKEKFIEYCETRRRDELALVNQLRRLPGPVYTELARRKIALAEAYEIVAQDLKNASEWSTP